MRESRGDDAERQRRRDRPPANGVRPPPEAPAQEEWIDAGPVRDEASRAVQRAAPARRQPSDRPPRPAPEEVAGELVRAAGASRAPRMQQRLMEAARAYERERYPDARRLLRPLAEQAPGAASVRELHGLTLYRMGRWRDAARELEAFRGLSGGSVEQHPVLADCYRALRRWGDVEALWEELRSASPGAELVTEGRIVMAGALADRGDIRAAINLLERGPVDPKHPAWHHLRLWYTLADLYERAGDVPRARQLFSRVQSHERGFADVAERLAGLA